MNINDRVDKTHMPVKYDMKTFMEAEFGRRLLAKEMAAHSSGLLQAYNLMGMHVVTTRGRISCSERIRTLYVMFLVSYKSVCTGPLRCRRVAGVLQDL